MKYYEINSINITGWEYQAKLCMPGAPLFCISIYPGMVDDYRTGFVDYIFFYIPQLWNLMNPEYVQNKSRLALAILPHSVFQLYAADRCGHFEEEQQRI